MSQTQIDEAGTSPDTRVGLYLMQEVRERLAASKHERQRAVAMFPVAVGGVAADMGRMLRLQELSSESEHLQPSIDHAETVIRTEYRKRFGCELGQHDPGQDEANPEANPEAKAAADSVLRPNMGTVPETDREGAESAFTNVKGSRGRA